MPGNLACVRIYNKRPGTRCWDNAQQTEEYDLLAEDGLVMRKSPSQPWRVSFGHVNSTAVLFYALTADATEVNGAPILTFHTAAKPSDLHWDLIEDPKAWTVLPTRFASPLRVCIELGGERFHICGCEHMATGPEESLFVHACITRSGRSRQPG